VLSDWHIEHGRRETRLGVVLWWISDDATASAAAADASASDAARAADAADDATASDAADATRASDAADDATADDASASDAADATRAASDASDAADDDAANQNLFKLLTKEPDMREGLKVIQTTGAYYGYAVTRVGWLRRVDGDEYELLPGAVTIQRTGERNLAGLDLLASGGLGNRYAASEPAESSEEIHRLLVRRSLPANEAAWASVCPKPKGWVEP
jgi:hypothetical protein